VDGPFLFLAAILDDLDEVWLLGGGAEHAQDVRVGQDDAGREGEEAATLEGAGVEQAAAPAGAAQLADAVTQALTSCSTSTTGAR
jgi:hypothetical protein